MKFYSVCKSVSAGVSASTVPREAPDDMAGYAWWWRRLQRRAYLKCSILVLCMGLILSHHVMGSGGEEAYTTVYPDNWTTAIPGATLAGRLVNETSTSSTVAPVSYRREGDYVLGGLFDLHVSQNGECGAFNSRGLQWMHAMVFAIEQVNARDDILPNVTLGFDIYDTCADPNVAVRNSVYFIAPQDSSSSCDGEAGQQDVVAVVGPSTSSAAVPVASLFNLFTLPQVSYAATSDILSGSTYEYFTRTIPPDTFQARAMAHLVKYFDFQTVAVLGNDDAAYGVGGIVVFEDEAQKQNICVAYKNIFGLDDSDKEFEGIVRDLRNIPEVRVIVAFTTEASISRLLTYFAEHDVTGYVWIGSDGWGSSKIVEDPRIAKVTNGMFGLTPHWEVIPEFDEYAFGVSPASLGYQDPFLNEIWQEYFQCYLPGEAGSVDSIYTSACTGKESLNSSYIFTNTSLISSVLDSVEVIARAMHAALGCTELHCVGDREKLAGDALLDRMKNVDFIGHSGYRLRPDENGNLAEVAWYDIYNLQPSTRCSDSFKLRRVGDWRDDIGEVIVDLEQLYWPLYNTCNWEESPPSSICGVACEPGTRRVTLDGSSCCWNCVRCSLNHFSNETDSLTCTPCSEEQMSNEDQSECLDLPYSYAKINSRIGIAAVAAAIIGWVLCVIIVIIFMLRENTVIIFHAFARSWKYIMLGIMMTFVTATLSVIPASELMCLIVAGTQLLPVSITEGSLILAAYTTYNRKHVQFNNWALSMIAVLFFHGQCILLWLLTSRPAVTKTIEREEQLVYVDCVSSGNYDGVIVVIAYGVILDIIGIFISFNIRNRDKNFQEGKFIFFSFIIQVMVWITILVIYLVLPPGQHYRTFVLSFGLMCSSVANLGCLFVPKLYVVRFKPGINPPIKKRYRDKLWQWKFKRREGEEVEEVTAEDRFGDSIRSHSARNAILDNYRKALAAILDETTQALRMQRVCQDRMEDMKLRHRRKIDELTMTAHSMKNSRVQLVLSSPTVEVTYC